MAKKIKATLTFEKIYSINREEETLTIVGESKESLNDTISPIIARMVKTETDTNGNQVYQCYLKSIEYGAINYVPEFDWSTCEKILNEVEMLQYIVKNKVHLIPDEGCWVNSRDNIVGITHKVVIEGKRYEGYTVPEAIHLHIKNFSNEVL